MKNRIDRKDLMFTDRYIIMMIIPMLAETFLNAAIGIADTIMVSSAGEASISGVSAVDSLVYLFVLIFTAFASGGSVIFSQYLGSGNESETKSSGRQLIQLTFLVGFACMVVLLLGRRFFLRLLLGPIDQSVVDASFSYIIPITLSLPFLGIMNASMAVSRAMGKSRLAMLIALLMNVMNVMGNALFIYGFHMGAFGAGLSSLIARIIASVVILMILTSNRVPVRISGLFTKGIEMRMVRSILHIAVPTGVETSVFHIGKILLTSLVATLGLTAMAAQAALFSVGNLVCLPGNAISLAIIPIIGQCSGAGRYDQAEYYAKRMMALEYISFAVLNIPMMFLIDPILGLYHLSPEAMEPARFMFFMLLLHVMLIDPPAFFLPQVFNAAGDVMFPMIVSTVSMWAFRVGSAYLLSIPMGLGIIGVQMAMFLDWYSRAIIFSIRFHLGRWKGKKVI